MSDPVANGDPSDYIDQSPEDAVNEYIVDRQGQRQRTMLKRDKGHLSVFVNWCDKHNIESLADLQPEHLTTYCASRREHHGLTRATLKHSRNSLQRFLRWAAKQQYCPRSLLGHIRDVDIDGSTKRHDHYLLPKYGDQIVKHLRNNNHGSEKHAMVEIGWSTGFRTSTIRSLDVDDIHDDENYIELEHRPETGTPLKRGSESERRVTIPEQATRAIQGWITNPNRPDGTDNYDRRPLFPALHGRRQQSSIGKILRLWPCQYLDVTSVNMESTESFDAESHSAVARDCPPSVSPQTLRKSVAIKHLNKGIAIQEIASRMDCSEEVLREWYGQFNEAAEMEHCQDGFNAGDE